MAAFWIIVGSVLCVGGLGLAAWMFLVEPTRFRVRRVTVREDEMPRSPAEGGPPRGLRILHITDTHFYGSDERKLCFLRRVARQEEYDFAFLTGDLIDTPRGVPSCAELAGALQPRAGSYAVLGGHDLYWMPPLALLASQAGGPDALKAARLPNAAGELTQELEANGVSVLQDGSRVAAVPRDGEVSVVGTQDAQDREPDYDAAWADVADDVPVVALTHCPDALPDIAARRPDMAFFGHTHGGQVRFPLLGALVTRSELPGDRASGMFREGDTLCFLNNGMGTNRYVRFRLLCRPEVSLVSIGG
mgnify:CR=1 FL=1